jgi:aflatoxin B1 aldehyde reductase
LTSATKLCVDPLRFHAPDESVPVAETMGAIQTLYEEDRFEKVSFTAHIPSRPSKPLTPNIKFGLSNMTSDQVLEYYNYAKSQNFIFPTIYQASYSPAVRGNEAALFPTLRSLGISIQA